jgi:hypothetical protein
VISAGAKGIPKGAQIEALGCEERATQGDQRGGRRASRREPSVKPWVARNELPRVTTRGAKGIPKGAQREALGCEERATQGDHAGAKGIPKGAQIEALGCEERATQGDQRGGEGHPEGSPA